MIKNSRSGKGNDSGSGQNDGATASRRDRATTAGARSPDGAPAVAPNDEVLHPGTAADSWRREHSFQLKLALLAGAFAIIAALAGALASGAFTSLGGHAASSPSTAPRVRGDSSAFIRDVTYPDYSKVQVNQHFTKIWELRDTGIVRWTGRYLAARGPASGKCTYPTHVRIPAIDPGDTVDIDVNVTAASSPGLCYVTWRMVTSAGQLYFPGDTGIWLKVNVIAAKPSA